MANRQGMEHGDAAEGGFDPLRYHCHADVYDDGRTLIDELDAVYGFHGYLRSEEDPDVLAAAEILGPNWLKRRRMYWLDYTGAWTRNRPTGVDDA